MLNSNFMGRVTNDPLPPFRSPEMNPDLRRRTDDLCTRLAQLRDSL
jgi:hypothetical protein